MNKVLGKLGLGLLLVSVLHSTEITLPKDYNQKEFIEKYKHLKEVNIEKKEEIQKILDSVQSNNGLINNGDTDLNSFYQKLTSTTSLLDIEGKFTEQIDLHFKTYEDTKSNIKNKEGFTILFFVSETTPVRQIKDFSIDIEKLKRLNKGIKGLVMTRGLVGGTFDSMAKYVANFEYMGIEKLDVTFHPWAFEHFKLEEVPAYALSYCDNNDFRFKNCDNRYLIRGEMSIRAFLEFVMEDDEDYSKYFYHLINN